MNHRTSLLVVGFMIAAIMTVTKACSEIIRHTEYSFVYSTKSESYIWISYRGSRYPV